MIGDLQAGLTPPSAGEGGGVATFCKAKEL